jgi:predicted CopG family antitoxin
MTESTTIKISKDTHSELKANALCEDETFDNIIKRILKERKTA